jgi:hypothetical protein
MKQLIPLIFSLVILGIFLIGCESISDPEPVSDALFSTGETLNIGTLYGGITKEMCKDDPGWEALGFRNQGQCVHYAQTGKDSREEFTISGTVYFGTGYYQDATITASGDHTETVLTNSEGQYTITGVPLGANVTITPSDGNFNFEPPSQSLENVSENKIGIDFYYSDPL